MSKQFIRTLETATDQTNVEPNWGAIMECIDFIRGKEVSTKDAAPAIIKRLRNSNPHVVHHALLLLEACMKNCGSNFHKEILSKKYLEELTEIIQSNPPNSEVTKKLLEMIQIWNTAFGNKFTAIKDTHSILKLSGYQFPAVKESDHMFVAQCAPDWVDGIQCFRCRTEFTFFKRKHHCRACGQIFCDACSSRQMYLSQFGIEKNVRVCESCFDKQTSKQNSAGNKDSSKTKIDEEEQRKRDKELADKFEEDLQLAIALSKSEAESYPSNRTQETKKLYDVEHIGQSSTNYIDEWVDNNARTEFSNLNLNEDHSIYRGAAAPSLSSVNSDQDHLSDIGIDTALAKYLDRDYWEKKLDKNNADPIQSEASAPYCASDVVSTRNGAMTPTPMNNVQNDYDSLKATTDNEIQETKRFCISISELVETLDNRIKSNLLRGRNIMNDSSCHMLFRQLNESYTSITERMQKLEAERTEYEQLQDQLSNIQDARQAIDALRQEHERIRQERLLAEQRQRQAQMQHTLSMMRWQKKNTLNYQREKALERFHEHEKQMMANRYGQTSQMNSNNFNGMPNMPVYMPQQPNLPQGMSNEQIFDSQYQQVRLPEMNPQQMHHMPSQQYSQPQTFTPEMMFHSTQPQFMPPSSQSINTDQLFNVQQLPSQQQLPADQQNIYPVQQNYM